MEAHFEKLITFAELEARYGGPVAEALLQQIERAANLRPQPIGARDPQSRLTQACDVQDRSIIVSAA